MAHMMTFLSKVNGKYENRAPYEVVKHDWVPTGRIDFATHLNGNGEDADQPNEFKLLVEERRIVESIAGNGESGNSMEACYAEGNKNGCNSLP